MLVTIRLFLSRGQRPTANRILFCNEPTTIEHIESFYMRPSLKGYLTEHAPLFCVIEPGL